MPNFGKLVDQAKKLAGKHPDQVNKVVDKAENAASEKTGGKYDSQIQQAGDQAEGFLGTKDQGTQGQAIPGQGAGNQ
jgi:antitoxin protein of toxin-antitoxin system